MDADENRRKVLEFYEALNSHDESRVISMLAEKVRYEDINLKEPIEGRDNIQRLYKKGIGANILESFPDMRYDIVGIVEDEDKVAVEWVLAGTQKHTFMGIIGMGKKIRVRGASVFMLVNGKIAEIKDYWNSSQIYDQISA